MDNDQFERLDKRLDRIENKLDNHLDRLSASEESIRWIRGHIKMGAVFISSLFVAIIGFLLAKFGR